MELHRPSYIFHLAKKAHRNLDIQTNSNKDLYEWNMKYHFKIIIWDG